MQAASKTNDFLQLVGLVVAIELIIGFPRIYIMQTLKSWKVVYMQLSGHCFGNVSSPLSFDRNLDLRGVFTPHINSVNQGMHVKTVSPKRVVAIVPFRTISVNFSANPVDIFHKTMALSIQND